jgi:hypothetical protein
MDIKLFNIEKQKGGIIPDWIEFSLNVKVDEFNINMIATIGEYKDKVKYGSREIVFKKEKNEEFFNSFHYTEVLCIAIKMYEYSKKIINGEKIKNSIPYNSDKKAISLLLSGNYLFKDSSKYLKANDKLKEVFKQE